MPGASCSGEFIARETRTPLRPQEGPVTKYGNAQLQRNALQFTMGRSQKKIGCVRDASANHDDLGSEIVQQDSQYPPQIAAKLLKDLGRCRVLRCACRDFRHFALVPGVFLVSLLNGTRGDQILDDSVFERQIPDFAPYGMPTPSVLRCPSMANAEPMPVPA